MNPFTWRSLYRSFQFKALFMATMSLALVVAILFAFSTVWLRHRQAVTEQQRSEELMSFLAANLQVGVMVQSEDLIRPVLRHALLTPEVEAIAVFDSTGTLLAHIPDDASTLIASYSPALAAQLRHLKTRRISETPASWTLATAVHKDTAPAAGASPADFVVLPDEGKRQVIGAILVHWNLVPGARWVAEFQYRFLIFSALAFAVVAVPTWFLTLYLNRGFSQLLEATQHVQRGNLHYQIASHRNDELGDVMRAFDSMVARTAEMTEQLQQERERALAASKAKSDFLASMSHELRTPLNAIIGFSEVLMEPVFGDLTEKQTAYVEDILESGRHLLSLINDILDLAKVESGRMDLEVDSVDLPRLLSSSVRLIRERATKHGIEISIDVDDNAKVVYADERKVKQVMFNLLSNAAKFTPDGGKVGIRVRGDDDSVTICVWDTGIGISESEQQRIFHDFYQGGSSLVRSQQGTGLGLSLVRKIAALHGGRAWVESELHKGSKFFVQFPRRPRTSGNESLALAAT